MKNTHFRVCVTFHVNHAYFVAVFYYFFSFNVLISVFFILLNYELTLNPAIGFQSPSATMVSAEPFSHGTGTLRCLQKEMAIYGH